MKAYSSEIQNYINANLKADLHSLLLKKSPFENVTMQEIVQQIKGQKVACKKFPFLLKEGIIFPPNLSLEQASSESTGLYKSKLVSGKKMLDITTGFGIDAYFLSENFEEVTLVEQNPELIKIVENNWKILDKKAEFINTKLEDFLSTNTEKFNLIYLDPARRDERKNKVFLLEDLSPNLLEIQDQLREISDKILIKLSPLIDISYLISVLKNIAEIHIVALKNDVKEILVLIDSKINLGKVVIKCVNLESGEKDFSFEFGYETNAKLEFGTAENFLYIPNNAVLKSGAFNLVSEQFNLKKLHPNTHLYTSVNFVEAFPGRVFEAEKINPKDLKKGDKFNIISKNYPLKPEEIKKKYKLNDGGGVYLVFTQDVGGKIVLKSK